MKDREPLDLPRSPISFPVNVSRLPQRGMPVRIVANETQRAELAEIHGLESVASLTAELLAAPWKRNGLRVTGTVRATIDQLCVVSGDPLQNQVDEEIDMIFLPEKSKLGREGFGQGGEIVLDFDGEDSPETFSGDWIDVGALAEEFFGLGIDLYPQRSDHAPTPDARDAPEDKPAQESQFARKLRAVLENAEPDAGKKSGKQK